MKALLLLVIATVPALAQLPPQEGPQQAAPAPLQLPSLELNFKDVQLPGRPQATFFNFKAPVMMVQAQPAVCAIPLLQVTPKGNYPMHVAKQRASEPNAPTVHVPAPACEPVKR